MKKRIFSILLVLTMVVTMLPCGASAAETPGATPEDGAKDMVSYSLDGGTTWEDARWLDAIFMCYTADNSIIKLKNDIVLGDIENYYPATFCYSNKSLTLDGNGHTIYRGTYDGIFFYVNGGNSQVTLRNITLDGGAVWSDVSDVSNRTNSGKSVSGTGYLIAVGTTENNNPGNDSLILESGTVLQNNHLSSDIFNGAAINMQNNSTVTMKEGAVIRNNAAINSGGDKGGGGGAVEVNGASTFNMEGGIIEGNYASVAGGAINVSNGSTFNMSGGEIRNNASGNQGGAVCVQSSGIFNMYSGEIQNNASGNNGGAVCVVQSYFTMDGGIIKNNKSFAGGGVISFYGTAELKGGTITGNDATSGLGGGVLVYNEGVLNVSGSPIVAGNTAKGSDNNIYLIAGRTITVTGELASEASLGITTKTKPTKDSPVEITGDVSAIIFAPDSFVSDDEKYGAEYHTDGKMRLVANTPSIVSFDGNGGEGTMEAQTFYVGCEKAVPANTFTREGYFFVGWNNEADGKGSISLQDKGKITLSNDTGITLYAQWIKIEQTTKPEDNAFHGDIDLNASEVIEKVDIPEAEKAAGNEIKVYLTVKDISATVTDADKSAIETAAGSDSVAAYLDIKLIKEVVPQGGTAVSEELHGTNGTINVSLVLPDEYINTDSSKIRTYYIIRLHNGLAERLLAQFDSQTKVLTFETDQFSTYALAYSDAAKPSTPSSGTYPVIQKPVIVTDDGAEVKLNSIGTTAEITVKDDFEIKEITVNGIPVEVTVKLTGLKTGDKVVITTAPKTEPATPANDRIIKGVENTKIWITKTSRGKGWIKLWYKKSFGYKVDYYEVFRSKNSTKNFGKTAFYQTKNNKMTGWYKNTKSVKKGNRYYYKVRGVRVIDGKKYYTKWSKAVYRTAK